MMRSALVLSIGRSLARSCTTSAVAKNVDKTGQHPSTNGNKHHPDNFGSLVSAERFDPKLLDPSKTRTDFDHDLDDDDGEAEFFAKVADSNRPRPREFEVRIRELLANHDLAAALKVFDDEMAREVVKPTEQTFRMVVHACSRVGYADKAFEVYSRMPKPHAGYEHFDMACDLYNACANCPSERRPAALVHARKLRARLDRKYATSVGQPVYNAMVKAFGRCGDLETAFEAVDEMAAKGERIDAYALGHLLHACISDKESGFRHAVIVYRKMVDKKIRPNVYTFNLLLRAARDCGIGEATFANDILLSAVSSEEVRRLRAANVEGQAGSRPATVVDTAVPVPPPTVRPNLLAKCPSLGRVVGLVAASTPADRLGLLGGPSGFVDVAVNVHKAQLDIKTFSLMLSCVEDMPQAEWELMGMMDRIGVVPDTDFFNQLMVRQNRRSDNESVRKTFDLMAQRPDCQPNLATYGCLAHTCRSGRDMFNFLDEIKRQRVRPNAKIMGPLVRRAAAMRRPDLVVALLQHMQAIGLDPCPKIVASVEKFSRTHRQEVLEAETAAGGGRPHVAVARDQAQDFQNWQRFVNFYPGWLKTTRILRPEDPWSQFTTDRDRARIRRCLDRTRNKIKRDAFV